MTVRRARSFVVTAMLVGISVAGLGACGRGSSESAVLPRVDASLAPAAIGQQLKLYPSNEKETVAAFANVGERGLVSDGRLWEIRRADRLVGALQLTTVLPKIDLTRERDRSTIVHQIIPGAANRIRVGDEEVYTTTVNDKATFVWFARDLYVVLQIKDRELKDVYDSVAADVIAHQARSPAWRPLPLDVEEDEGRD